MRGWATSCGELDRHRHQRGSLPDRARRLRGRARSRRSRSRRSLHTSPTPPRRRTPTYVYRVTAINYEAAAPPSSAWSTAGPLRAHRGEHTTAVAAVPARASGSLTCRTTRACSPSSAAWRPSGHRFADVARCRHLPRQQRLDAVLPGHHGDCVAERTYRVVASNTAGSTNTSVHDRQHPPRRHRPEAEYFEEYFNTRTSSCPAPASGSATAVAAVETFGGGDPGPRASNSGGGGGAPIGIDAAPANPPPSRRELQRLFTGYFAPSSPGPILPVQQRRPASPSSSSTRAPNGRPRRRHGACQLRRHGVAARAWARASPTPTAPPNLSPEVLTTRSSRPSRRTRRGAATASATPRRRPAPRPSRPNCLFPTIPVGGRRSAGLRQRPGLTGQTSANGHPSHPARRSTTPTATPSPRASTDSEHPVGRRRQPGPCASPRTWRPLQQGDLWSARQQRDLHRPTFAYDPRHPHRRVDAVECHPNDTIRLFPRDHCSPGWRRVAERSPPRATSGNGAPAGLRLPDQLLAADATQDGRCNALDLSFISSASTAPPPPRARATRVQPVRHVTADGTIKRPGPVCGQALLHRALPTASRLRRRCCSAPPASRGDPLTAARPPGSQSQAAGSHPTTGRGVRGVFIDAHRDAPARRRVRVSSPD